jgi:hypothetical protein
MPSPNFRHIYRYIATVKRASLSIAGHRVSLSGARAYLLRQHRTARSTLSIFNAAIGDVKYRRIVINLSLSIGSDITDTLPGEYRASLREYHRASLCIAAIATSGIFTTEHR